jgi:hypothetical protein
MSIPSSVQVAAENPPAKDKGLVFGPIIGATYGRRSATFGTLDRLLGVSTGLTTRNWKTMITIAKGA